MRRLRPFLSGCGRLTLVQDIEVWNPFDAGAGQTVLYRAHCGEDASA